MRCNVYFDNGGLLVDIQQHTTQLSNWLFLMGLLPVQANLNDQLNHGASFVSN